MKYLSSLKNKNLSEKTCLLRVDFNVEEEDLKEPGRIPFRVTAVLPTLEFLIQRGAKIIILSHRGRPKVQILNSKFEIRNYSLKPFAAMLSELLKKSVQFIDFKKDFRRIKTITEINPGGTIFLLENLRFFPEEERNDKGFARKLVSLGDFYINDAFSVSHRRNASIAAIAGLLPSYAGLLLEKEIKNLSQAIKKPKKPLVVVLGGAKISDKIGMVKNFLKKADEILIGGGIANIFFAAQKLPVNGSLYERKMVPVARKLLKFKKIILPFDSAIQKGKILDIGPETIKKYTEVIKKAKTIVWNGPMGYIENPEFAKGSKAIVKAILESRAFSIIGGGETTGLVASSKYKMSGNTFISTGGGAMLEYLSGKKLPGIAALENSRASLASGGKR
jgi:3-phosphoglycerate kinase